MKIAGTRLFVCKAGIQIDGIPDIPLKTDVEFDQETVGLIASAVELHEKDARIGITIQFPLEAMSISCPGGLDEDLDFIRELLQNKVSDAPPLQGEIKFLHNDCLPRHVQFSLLISNKYRETFWSAPITVSKDDLVANPYPASRP